MNRFKLLLLSATPFIIGYLLNFAMIKFNWYGMIVSIISLMFFVYWFWIGYKSYDYVKTVKESILIGNSFAIISLISILFQRHIHRIFMSDIVVFAPQMFYLPMVRLTSWIQRTLLFFISTHYMISTFVFSCILMIALYYIGYLMNSKR